ncbi:hypothetical protein [Legionella shakespearei]|uniref:DUF883 domain-containing protein n=1 Tax=Legionella shakespearei DSM 23087 TaxID=1122169 RepID=A0A0W0YT63_9GAMM|nr:hypothetical protein [Legionella shakespearei]KTD60064.1 hypothetical protein Lsha_1814 [Legionella shakespearei DSM 23087]
MESLNKSKASNDKANVGAAAAELLKESKKLANELYEEGLGKVSDVEENVKQYSDQLLKKVQENPLTSVLVAGGIGFLLSKILSK